MKYILTEADMALHSMIKEKLKAYGAIGTVEEFKALKEKAEPKKEDCCEWKSGKGDDWTPSCEPNATYKVFGVGWFRYCPYCGKRIKISEVE